MSTSLDTVIGRLRILSELEQEEAHRNKRLFLKSADFLDMSDPATHALLRESAPARAALTAYLSALPVHYLRALVALIYSGRDEESDIVGYWNTFNFDANDAAQLIETIVEKHGRMEVMGIGISYLPDTDALNALPAAFK